MMPRGPHVAARTDQTLGAQPGIEVGIGPQRRIERLLLGQGRVTALAAADLEGMGQAALDQLPRQTGGVGGRVQRAAPLGVLLRMAGTAGRGVERGLRDREAPGRGSLWRGG